MSSDNALPGDFIHLDLISMGNSNSCTSKKPQQILARIRWLFRFLKIEWMKIFFIRRYWRKSLYRY